ncbi:hypothetical protein JD844_012826 [Phrynosoma platyrhinos]|uniref:Uncharacterized protein n=1 Tax=Phrynosoma platyrhinos TaxID=52577 RepID=A0ABQ7TL12_PHRPL|nr:hypothetical protein JD844_012826 [Phrynosoma platyrhinos]
MKEKCEEQKLKAELSRNLVLDMILMGACDDTDERSCTIDTHEEDQLREEESDRDVAVNASSVGLETFQADQEGECQQ